MNPKLMAALKGRKRPDSNTEVAPEVPGESATPGLDDGHAKVRHHLEKGMAGSRRHARLHLKLALHAHKAACGH